MKDVSYYVKHVGYTVKQVGYDGAPRTPRTSCNPILYILLIINFDICIELLFFNCQSRLIWRRVSRRWTGMTGWNGKWKRIYDLWARIWLGRWNDLYIWKQRLHEMSHYMASRGVEDAGMSYVPFEGEEDFWMSNTICRSRGGEDVYRSYRDAYILRWREAGSSCATADSCSCIRRLPRNSS